MCFIKFDWCAELFSDGLSAAIGLRGIDYGVWNPIGGTKIAPKDLQGGLLFVSLKVSASMIGVLFLVLGIGSSYGGIA